MACSGRYCNQLPSTVSCAREGFDGSDATWRCTVEGLPNTLRLAQASVTCEGFDYPDDPYVLAGSCGVELSLEPSGVGNPDTVNTNSYNNWKPSSSYSYADSHSSSSSLLSSLFSIGVFALIFWLIYRTCVAPLFFSGPSVAASAGTAPAYGYQQPTAPVYTAAPAAAPSSSPGFFSGLGLGSLLGYWWRPSYSYGYGYQPPTYYGGSGGYYNAYPSNNSYWGSGWGSSSSSSSYSAPSGGSSSSGGATGTHSSSTYANTRRR